MLYEFQLVGGTERIERSYPMSEAPEIGAKIKVGGKSYVRIFSVPELDAGIAQVVNGYPYQARNLPQGLEGADHDANGRCIIRSRLHEKEFSARHNLRRD